LGFELKGPVEGAVNGLAGLGGAFGQPGGDLPARRDGIQCAAAHPGQVGLAPGLQAGQAHALVAGVALGLVFGQLAGGDAGHVAEHLGRHAAVGIVAGGIAGEDDAAQGG
jgi:hypothetical protein